MTVMELNTDIYRSLSLLSDDEAYLKKAAKALKRLVKEKEQDDYMPRTKEELKGDFIKALEEVKLDMEGTVKMRDAEELIDEL